MPYIKGIKDSNLSNTWSQLTDEQRSKVVAQYGSKKKARSAYKDARTRFAGDKVVENPQAAQPTGPRGNPVAPQVQDINNFDTTAGGAGSKRGEDRLSAADLLNLEQQGFSKEQIIEYSEKKTAGGTKQGKRAQNLLNQYKDDIKAATPAPTPTPAPDPKPGPKPPKDGSGTVTTMPVGEKGGGGSKPPVSTTPTPAPDPKPGPKSPKNEGGTVTILPVGEEGGGRLKPQPVVKQDPYVPNPPKEKQPVSPSQPQPPQNISDQGGNNNNVNNSNNQQNNSNNQIGDNSHNNFINNGQYNFGGDTTINNWTWQAASQNNFGGGSSYGSGNTGSGSGSGSNGNRTTGDVTNDLNKFANSSGFGWSNNQAPLQSMKAMGTKISDSPAQTAEFAQRHGAINDMLQSQNHNRNHALAANERISNLGVNLVGLDTQVRKAGQIARDRATLGQARLFGDPFVMNNNPWVSGLGKQPEVERPDLGAIAEGHKDDITDIL